MKKNAFKILLILLSILAAAGCTPTAVETSVESLEFSVREILELPTYEQIYRDVVYVGEEQKILFFTTKDKEVLFAIDIRIQAGIKNAGLIGIEITGEKKDGQKLARVRLPKSEVILVDADESSINQYFIKEKGEEISRLEYYDEINRQKVQLVNKAVETGLLDQADLNAQKLIKSFLALSNIEVSEFQEIGSEI